MNDGQTTPDGVSTPDGGSDATDAMFVEVAPMTCSNVDTPGHSCGQPGDLPCCSGHCSVALHQCTANAAIMTQCGNNSDCGGDGMEGVCALMPTPDGGTAMRCTILEVGAMCDPSEAQCPGGCDRVSMTCYASPENGPCLPSRGNADCMPGFRCIVANTATGAGGCVP